jgi:adenylate cyclase, class 2
MNKEVEVKILDINRETTIGKLAEIGADLIGEYRLIVDWYRPIGEQLGEENWYLRIRKYSNGKSEVTWKGLSKKAESSRSHKELNFEIESPELLGELFKVIGLEHYAHQEKDRMSWSLLDWKFDLDKYPGMPAYLEIEGKSNEHIGKAIKMLELEKQNTSTEGERVLIMNMYKLNWLEMRF